MIEKITAQSEAFAEARKVRHIVFVEEQGVSAEEEYDEYDAVATHFLARDADGNACATARWHTTEEGVKLGRFAVLPTHRNKGVGQSLVQAVLEDIANSPAAVGKLLYLYAQESAIGLYLKFGFETVGEPFYEANIRHMKMSRTL